MGDAGGQDAGGLEGAQERAGVQEMIVFREIGQAARSPRPSGESTLDANLHGEVTMPGQRCLRPLPLESLECADEKSLKSGRLVAEKNTPSPPTGSPEG